MDLETLKRRIKRIPQFFTDKEFRDDAIRRRLLYPALTKGVGKFFPNVKHFRVFDGQNWFTADMHDRGTAWSLLVHGHLDHDHFENALALAEKEGLLKKGGNHIFIDAGANIGTHSIYALSSDYFDRVIAIEPNPNNYELLERNIADNGFESRATLFHAALGKEDGEATLELSANHSGDHRVRIDESGKNADKQLKGEADRKTITVPLRSLDSIIKECDVKDIASVFVSIDVQGFEAHILDGAHKLMEQGAVFSIEFWPYGLRYTGAVEYLNGLLEKNFESYYDIRGGLEAEKESMDRLDDCYARYPETAFTDLLLVQGKKLKKPKKKKAA